MTTLTKTQAIELLGEYAYNQRTGAEIESRINALIDFSKTNQNVAVAVNNNWSNPPKAKTAKNHLRLGGTTFKYQVWAIAL